MVLHLQYLYTHLAQKGAPHMMRQEWWKSFCPPIHHYVELQVGYNQWYKRPQVTLW